MIGSGAYFLHHLVKPLAAKVGEVIYAETISQDFTGNFYHVWVLINVFKPLKNAVSMIRGGRGRFTR